MNGAGAIVFQGMGPQGQVESVWMANESTPEKSQMVKIETKSSFDGEIYSFEVKRPIDPLKGKGNKKRMLHGAAPDVKVKEFNQILPTNKEFDMAWAECSESSYLKEHDMYGVFRMTLPQTGGSGVVTTYNDVYLRHGIIMWCAWFILGFFMFATNRWFSHLTNKSGLIHAFFGYSIIAMNAYAASSIIALTGIKTYRHHHKLGLLTSVGLIFFGISGILSFIAKKRL